MLPYQAVFFFFSSRRRHTRYWRGSSDVCSSDLVEALVGIGVGGEVRVRGDLPAGEVDRLEARLDHLDRLATGQRTKRRDVLLRRQQPPEPLGAQADRKSVV